MYILIDSKTIIPYDGESLKRYVGNRLVKVISNPTDEDLLEFGYLPLVDGDTPECDSETQYLVPSYSVEDGSIHRQYTVTDIPEDATPEEVVGDTE